MPNALNQWLIGTSVVWSTRISNAPVVMSDTYTGFIPEEVTWSSHFSAGASFCSVSTHVSVDSGTEEEGNYISKWYELKDIPVWVPRPPEGWDAPIRMQAIAASANREPV